MKTKAAWKEIDHFLLDDYDRIEYVIDINGRRLCPYIRDRGDVGRHATYFNCSGDYTKKQAYNRMRSGRLIFM